MGVTIVRRGLDTDVRGQAPGMPWPAYAIGVREFRGHQPCSSILYSYQQA